MRMCEFRKLRIMGVLVLALTLGIQAASSKETAAVKDVSLNSVGMSLEARITTTESAKFTYFELEGPHRLVVDFHGLKNGIGFSQKSIQAVGVERVRTSYFKTNDRAATRIVFDIDKNVNYRVIDDGDGIVRILFSEAGVPFPLENKVVPTTLLVGIGGPQKTEEPTLSFPVVRLESLSPEAQVAGVQAETVQAAPPEPAPAEQQAPIPAPQVLPPGTQLSPRISTAAEPGAPAVTGPAVAQVFNGEIIDLNLNQADIRDFFRFIGMVSGLNIVVDPNVSGTVTVLLMDVPWDQALDIILRNYNLGGILEGQNVLRIATRATLQQEEAQRKAARDAVAAAIPPRSQTFVLDYAKASEVSATLLASGVLSPRGRITPEPRRNALIVTDMAEQFEGIEKLINFIDTPSQQVEIEARLLAANKSFSREFGSQIGLLVGARDGNMFTGGVGESSPFQRTPAPRVTVEGGEGLPLLTNLPAAATSGAAFLLQPGADILLDAIITAAEARGTARLLSQPKVMTENNKKATISQGTKIPVQTNVNNTITTTFLTFALKLDVTPQITEDGTILMLIDIENSQPDFARTVNGVPSISTQQAITQTWVPDGNTMMVGGIFVDTDSLNVRQVPGLGSIPIIGHLFKNTQTIKSQAELFFFITPRIKKPDAVATTAPRN
jgi:type IV pilus assembly protein PilQ